MKNLPNEELVWKEEEGKKLRGRDEKKKRGRERMEVRRKI